jgi:hypothetical protein
MKRAQKDLSSIERDWRARGFSLELKGRVLRPKPGEEVLIPAKAVHSVRNKSRGASRWLYGYRKSS